MKNLLRYNVIFEFEKPIFLLVNIFNKLYLREIILIETNKLKSHSFLYYIYSKNNERIEFAILFLIVFTYIMF